MSTHRLVAFEEISQNVTDEILIPLDATSNAMRVAGVPLSDPNGIGCYALTSEQATAIAEFAGEQIGLMDYEWFLEPVAAPNSSDNEF